MPERERRKPQGGARKAQASPKESQDHHKGERKAKEGQEEGSCAPAQAEKGADGHPARARGPHPHGFANERNGALNATSHGLGRQPANKGL